LYLGVLFNVMIMGTVSLAAIKIGAALLGFSPYQSVLIAMVVTVVYCGLGGIRSVVITDFLLFSFAMSGAVVAAVVVCRNEQVGGLSGLFSNPQVRPRLDMAVAFTDKESFFKSFVPIMLIPLAVQWWSVWYPGSEPGGGGYLVQRMLSAKNEKNAIGATLLFNVCHYALRPWPWIIVALASLIIFPMDSPSERAAAGAALKSPAMSAIVEQYNKNPDAIEPHTRQRIQELTFAGKGLTSLRAAFPDRQTTPDSKIGHDLAYPAMLRFLPAGLLGIVVASLIAAYMSTMASHLNWGSSYIVYDFYKRFVRPRAAEKELVLVGRLATVVLMILSAMIALWLENALQGFHIIIMAGAGTGLIFILRWFWHRINAWTEITGLAVSFAAGLYMVVIHEKLGFAPIPEHFQLLIGVAVTTAAWLLVTFLTKPSDDKTLRNFYRLVRPGGPGWNKVIEKARAEGDPIEKTVAIGDLPRGIICMLAGTVAVYSAIFAAGYFLYGKTLAAIICTALAGLGAAVLLILWGKLEMC
jgi:Na+/proline symporter